MEESVPTKSQKDALARFPVRMVANGHNMVDANLELRKGYETCLMEVVYPLKVELYELKESKTP